MSYGMGDTVSVQVARVNVTERKMDFELISHEPLVRRRHAPKPQVNRAARSRGKAAAKSSEVNAGKSRAKAKVKPNTQVLDQLQVKKQRPSNGEVKANGKGKGKGKSLSAMIPENETLGEDEWYEGEWEEDSWQYTSGVDVSSYYNEEDWWGGEDEWWTDQWQEAGEEVAVRATGSTATSVSSLLPSFPSTLTSTTSLGTFLSSYSTELCPLDCEKRGEWMIVWAMYDSGCGESSGPSFLGSNLEIRPSRMSLAGDVFSTANDESVGAQGRRVMPGSRAWEMCRWVLRCRTSTSCCFLLTKWPSWA